MMDKLIKVFAALSYIIILFFIAAVTFGIIRYTDNNPYIIAFLSICYSNWLLGSIIKIIKKIGDKKGWFDE